MGDFRAISLCITIYKIVVKMIAHLLKPVMHHLLISEAQSAFILGLLITDNILIAAEVMHYLKEEKAS